MTISTSLPRTTLKASSVTTAFPPVISLARCKALSATTVMRIARPARRWISSAFRLSTSQVPPPTVPIPSNPTLMGFMPAQSEEKMLFHVGPFVHEDAVHHGVADGAVAPHPVMADHAVLLRAERLDGALGAEVEVVGAQTHDFAFQGFKCMGEQQKLTDGVDVRALDALRVPRPANLHAVRGGDDVVVTGAPDDLASFQFAHCPREHRALLLSRERGGNIGLGLVRLGNRRVEELPEAAVLCGGGKSLLMFPGERLEAHPVAFELGRFRRDHAAPLRSPSFLNMSRMPRTAWRRRCSFSMRARRTWSSP